jgi:hypothetical protein
MDEQSTDLRPKAGPTRAYLLLAAFATAVPLAAYAFFERATGPFDGPRAAVIAAASLLATALLDLVRRRKTAFATAWLAASATAFAGVCMAASKAADAPIFLLTGFLTGIVACVILLMRDIDELLPPKLLMAVAVAQILALTFVIS